MTHSTDLRLDPVSFAGLLALAAVWGGSFFFAEIALRELSPRTITLHRVFWALPALYAMLRLAGHRVPREARLWGAYLVMGALNNALPFTLIFWGQRSIESGLASILNGTTAIFGAVVAGLLLADERLSARKLAGAALGLGGVGVIMGRDALTGLDPRDLGQLAILGAALSYAFASVWGRTALGRQPPLVNAFGMVAGSSVIMVGLTLALDGVPDLSLAPATWGAVLSLALLSTALAYGLYFAVLRRAGAANLMLVTLLIPPFAITLGALALDETLPPGALPGFALIALGLAVTDGRLLRAMKNAPNRRGRGVS